MPTSTPTTTPRPVTSGVELQNQQEITINPERPIRVHPTPRRAGLSDFEHAAQKSADVIRFHPRSRWVDNSIMMIGKSYFYQQRYFSADQKFVELLAATSDPALRQEAIFWRGRAALELENYVEGVNYIQSRLFSTEFDWDRRIEADVRLIIAQLLVARGEYEDAVGYIADALAEHPESAGRKCVPGSYTVSFLKIACNAMTMHSRPTGQGHAPVQPELRSHLLCRAEDGCRGAQTWRPGMGL
jgi:tetratricopeptide (TPR) repeat protein